MALADFLKSRRDKLDLSMDDVSARCGVAKSAISGLETGKTVDPKVSTLLRVSRALRIPPRDAFRQAIKGLEGDGE